QRRIVLRRAMAEMRSLPHEQWSDAPVVQKLWTGWGNTGWSASPDFLSCMIMLAAKVKGPILECGSGLTTLLLGIVAARALDRVWSLEHDPGWYENTMAAMVKHRIDTVHIDLAPLRNYGEFEWYEPSFAKMPTDFSLVICDGPPEGTRGGRYG